MFSLAQPILLLAGAGIIVPVLIHLWNVRRGKLRKVGSVQLLKQNAHSRARSLKVSERWLLLLRCLLILVITVLLTKPFLTIRPESKGWVLAEPSFAKLPAVDSLRRAGFEYKNLDTIPYWSLLKMLEKKLPPNVPVYLFTGRKLARFKGERPQVSMDLHWQSFETNDTMETEVAQSVDSMKVLMYADEKIDLKYLIAALEAIQQKTKLSLSAEVLSGDQPQEADWLFWLSERPLPGFVKASKVFMYAKEDDNAVIKRSTTNPSQYLFTGRLRPSSSDMVWKGEFAERLFELLVADKSIEIKDNRQIDPAQMMPEIADKKSSTAFMEQKDMRLYFWLAAFVLFAIERIVSLRKKEVYAKNS